MVIGGDFVVENDEIGAIEIHALLEPRLIIGVKWQSAPIVGMGTSHEARLDLKHS